MDLICDLGFTPESAGKLPRHWLAHHQAAISGVDRVHDDSRDDTDWDAD